MQAVLIRANKSLVNRYKYLNELVAEKKNGSILWMSKVAEHAGHERISSTCLFLFLFFTLLCSA